MQTRDAEAIIVPNSVLAQSAVMNYTLDNSHYRLKAVLGVVYASDGVRALLAVCSDAVQWRLRDLEPQLLNHDLPKRVRRAPRRRRRPRRLRAAGPVRARRCRQCR